MDKNDPTFQAILSSLPCDDGWDPNDALQASYLMVGIKRYRVSGMSTLKSVSVESRESHSLSSSAQIRKKESTLKDLVASSTDPVVSVEINQNLAGLQKELKQLKRLDGQLAKTNGDFRSVLHVHHYINICRHTCACVFLCVCVCVHVCFCGVRSALVELKSMQTEAASSKAEELQKNMTILQTMQDRIAEGLVQGTQASKGSMEGLPPARQVVQDLVSETQNYVEASKVFLKRIRAFVASST